MLLLLAFAAVVGARTGENALKVKYPGGRTYMFRVELKDKRGTPFSLNRPAEFLSKKGNRHGSGLFPTIFMDKIGEPWPYEGA